MTTLPVPDPAARDRLRELLGVAPQELSQPARLVGVRDDVPAGTPQEVEVVRPLRGPAGADGGAASDGPAMPEGVPGGGSALAPAPPGSPAALAPAFPALLLRPDPEKATGAAVVLVAGHGRGIDDLVVPDGYHDALAHKLVDAGMTVLCPEMISFGRRRFARPGGAVPEDPAESTCGIDAARYLLHGRPVMGRRVADAAAAAQALRDLPGVDPERVAVAGGSGGGAVSLLLAAVDPSIAAALVATYFASFSASLASIRHCPCNIVPSLLPELEMADVAALIAPRPLVIEAGEQDHIFPIAATRESFGSLAPVWEATGGPAPQLVVEDGGHAFRAGRSLELLVARV